HAFDPHCAGNGRAMPAAQVPHAAFADLPGLATTEQSAPATMQFPAIAVPHLAARTRTHHRRLSPPALPLRPPFGDALNHAFLRDGFSSVPPEVAGRQSRVRCERVCVAVPPRW